MAEPIDTWRQTNGGKLLPYEYGEENLKSIIRRGALPVTYFSPKDTGYIMGTSNTTIAVNDPKAATTITAGKDGNTHWRVENKESKTVYLDKEQPPHSELANTKFVLYGHRDNTSLTINAAFTKPMIVTVPVESNHTRYQITLGENAAKVNLLLADGSYSDKLSNKITIRVPMASDAKLSVEACNHDWDKLGFHGGQRYGLRYHMGNNYVSMQTTNPRLKPNEPQSAYEATVTLYDPKDPKKEKVLHFQNGVLLDEKTGKPLIVVGPDGPSEDEAIKISKHLNKPETALAPAKEKAPTTPAQTMPPKFNNPDHPAKPSQIQPSQPGVGNPAAQPHAASPHNAPQQYSPKGPDLPHLDLPHDTHLKISLIGQQLQAAMAKPTSPDSPSQPQQKNLDRPSVPPRR